MKMKPVKIFHEAPLSLFDAVQEMTDGDYALVHLLDKDDTYASKFVYRQRGERPLILDNSAYELGAAFDEKEFIEWIEYLSPDTYVVPDLPGNQQATIDAFARWMKEHGSLPGRKMGVIQGKSAPEAVNCFKALKALGADIIGIPFLIGRRWFEAIEKRPAAEQLMQRRISLIDQIWDHCEPHPIHLLGVALPQEGVYYKEMSWIESVDTSNPVIQGMFGGKYGPKGLTTKRPEMMADFMHEEVSEEQEKDIFHNIIHFKEFWERKC